jgi:hypothetical protein
MTSPYGSPPVELDSFDLTPPEMQFTLYMPIKLRGEQEYKIPPRLQFLSDIITEVHHTTFACNHEFRDHYVYVTCKTLYVQPGAPGNRPGWHVDGWGSGGDLNYIWYNMNPTEFAIQPFADVPDDDIESMKAFEDQVGIGPYATYPCKTLLRLDEGVVHRVGPVVTSGVRTFVKVSVSKHRYNLEGNSHNDLLDYKWDMVDRVSMRNVDNKDFVL